MSHVVDLVSFGRGRTTTWGYTCTCGKVVEVGTRAKALELGRGHVDQYLKINETENHE